MHGFHVKIVKNGVKMSKKREKGQYFTVENPFILKPFKEWFNSIEEKKKEILLEPFAGANNIVVLLSNAGIKNKKWVCLDIEPVNDKRNSSGFIVENWDTLRSYPKNYNVVITNPPYLAKNSAKRRGIDFPNTKHDDIYKEALEIMLNGSEYVAAIIPESFVTQKIFHNRLESVISLTCEMFNDTEVPVCLALFVPENKKSVVDDFDIYDLEEKIGSYVEINKKTEFLLELKNEKNKKKIIKFNDKNGVVGFFAVDNHATESIKFVDGDFVVSSKIKISSRNVTKISIEGINKQNKNLFIEKANELIKTYRKESGDVLMTSFKGLRKDGKYRRRMDFNQARKIIEKTLEDFFTGEIYNE